MLTGILGGRRRFSASNMAGVAEMEGIQAIINTQHGQHTHGAYTQVRIEQIRTYTEQAVKFVFFRSYTELLYEHHTVAVSACHIIVQYTTKSILSIYYVIYRQDSSSTTSINYRTTIYVLYYRSHFTPYTLQLFAIHDHIPLLDSVIAYH